MKDEKPLTEKQIRDIYCKEYPAATEEELNRYVRMQNSQLIARQFMERQKAREIKKDVRKAFPGKSEEELDQLTHEALGGAEWYVNLKKGKKSANLLKSEYVDKDQEYRKGWKGGVSEEQADELAKSQDHEEWFKALKEGPRLADKPKTGTDAIVVAANAGGVEKHKTPDIDAEKYGEQFGYAKQYDEETEEQMQAMEIAVQAAERAYKIAMYGRTQGTRNLHISIGMQLLRGQPQIQELAEYHDLTPQRVKQAINEVKSFEIFDH
jgi:hypothetical protein